MEKKKIIKICEKGIIRELSESEILEYEKENKAETPQQITFSYDEAVNLKIRERYTESQEFAILRQRDEKPEEYDEYYEYCEQCKSYVKEQLIRNNNIE